MRAGVEGVLVGRGVLRNPWILAQAGDLAAGRAPRAVTLADRGRFLLEYIDLLLHERVDELRAASHDRWVINKLRALGSYYTKGLENGSHLRTAINTAESLARLRDTIVEFFAVSGGPAVSAAGRPGVAADPAAARTTVPAAAPTNGPATAPTSVPVAVPTGVSAAVRPGVPAGVPTGVPAAVPSGVPTAIAAASH
jgi:hypothetical protein